MKIALNDLFVIHDRMLAPYLMPPAADRVRQLRIQLKEDGSWPDVNYAGTSTKAWEPAEHLRRLLTLTQAWFAPMSAEHGNAELVSKINRTLDYWLRKDPHGQWWWDRIGAPGTLSLILLMLDENLTDFQRRKGIEILERAKLDKTGQNLIWQAEITACRAVLQRDSNLLRRVFKLICSEIRLSDGEGIQADFSFHQHGHCLYNHGYELEGRDTECRFVFGFRPGGAAETDFRGQKTGVVALNGQSAAVSFRAREIKQLRIKMRKEYEKK